MTNQKYSTAKLSDRTSRMLISLADAPDGLTSYEIAKKLGESALTITKSTSMLTTSRRAVIDGLRHIDNGPKRKPVYHITDTGRKFLAGLKA